VLAQAAGFAFLAALSPTALLVAAVYLGSARPRLTALCYLAGAVLATLVIGIAVLVALRSGHLEQPSHHGHRDWLRLGLGLLMVAAGVAVALRKPRPPDPSRPHKGIVSRLVSDPAPLTAFVAGVLVFMPSVTFIAAVQVIATARADAELSAVSLAVVIIIDVCFVWLPFLTYLAAPGLTARRLAQFNRWLRAHGQTLLCTALLAAGAILAIDGAVGLVSNP
jgi:Sap, sulfolipid-1-addressing protein